MASFLKVTKFFSRNVAIKNAYSSILTSRASHSHSSMVGHWNWDWKPADVPTTPEQRAAAAEKYGLRVEDYEPFPDDGMGHGDYPNLPPVGQNSRDPYEDWDMPEIKKNFKEPIGYDADMYREELYDPNMKYRDSLQYMLTFILGILGFNFGMFYLTQDYPHHQAVLKKQFPSQLKEGEVHYTFKPAQ